MTEQFKTVVQGDLGPSHARVSICERISPEYYALEKERVFRRSWLPLMFTYELPDPGSYAVVEVPTFKTQLLVVRGADGAVRAFHNVCRHRGNRLVNDAAGCKRRFTCGYHGWSYSASGELKAVPDEAQFVDFDKVTLGLLPVKAELWEEFLFVNFDPDPEESLADWLGEWFSSHKGYFSGRRSAGGYSLEVKANWNLAINAFTEGYHTLWVHSDTLPDYQGGKSNPLRHRPYLELGRRHALYSAHANPDRTPSPIEAAVYGRSTKLFPSFDVDISQLPPGVNPSQFGEWAYDMRELFPNACLMTGANWHTVLWFWPITHDRTIVRFEVYVGEAKRPSDHFAHAYHRVRNREVAREDIGTLERTQAALEAGALPFNVMSNQELVLQHHFKVVAEMIKSGGTARHDRES